MEKWKDDFFGGFRVGLQILLALIMDTPQSISKVTSVALVIEC